MNHTSASFIFLLFRQRTETQIIMEITNTQTILEHNLISVSLFQLDKSGPGEHGAPVKLDDNDKVVQKQVVRSHYPLLSSCSRTGSMNFVSYYGRLLYFSWSLISAARIVQGERLQCVRLRSDLTESNDERSEVREMEWWGLHGRLILYIPWSEYAMELEVTGKIWTLPLGELVVHYVFIWQHCSGNTITLGFYV